MSHSVPKEFHIIKKAPVFNGALIIVIISAITSSKSEYNKLYPVVQVIFLISDY